VIRQLLVLGGLFLIPFVVYGIYRLLGGGRPPPPDPEAEARRKAEEAAFAKAHKDVLRGLKHQPTGKAPTAVAKPVPWFSLTVLGLIMICVGLVYFGLAGGEGMFNIRGTPVKAAQ